MTTTLPLRHRAEQLAASLPPLLVAAERVASTVAQGVHGRRRVGQGETFWQFRHYDMGDQPQSIDWRQSAKSDMVFVREMEWEAAQSVWIWRDTSASMSWSSDRNHQSKRERADLLTLALSVLLMRGGEHVALLGSGLRPSNSRANLSQTAVLLESENQADEELPQTLPLPRSAQIVLIGDFLAPLPDIDRTLRYYGESGVRGTILQVLDPAEESLPYDGRVNFEGLEEEAPWLVSRVESVRGDYAKRLQDQRDGLRDITRALGWGCDFHRSDQPPQAALLRLYTTLSQVLA
ncbi:DUF58 domain-containing protein [Pelagibius litoralis]|uniref:DUF58 domain-containing protein n=1 Tax=Pelagibius litoralis TaxID=374515 RepID=A0A967F1V9_9PROT|nr:DUF58 domain-containing protein [Pelagibius litoralis]NIA71643.1 DUF58 domain-containing protein [Pelagibius litoralis]